MMNYEKILKISTLVLFVVTAVILILFIFGGEVPNQVYYTPVYTAAILDWAYILAAIAVIAALIFPIIRLFTRPKQAMKSLIGVLALVVICGIAYLMSDGTPLNIVGYTGEDNVPSTLIYTDMLIYTIYLLFIVLVLALIGTEVYKRLK
ncbi:MAG: hypothetical protein LBM07_06605 [Culturomica sp.]|jgi:hypothetical protein|nr:hypothetical protein [Culturomica sp.]